MAAVIIHFCPGDWISSEDNLIWARHLSAGCSDFQQGGGGPQVRVIVGPRRVPSLGRVEWRGHSAGTVTWAPRGRET